MICVLSRFREVAIIGQFCYLLPVCVCLCVSVCVGCQSGGGAGRGLPAGREGGGPCEGQAALPPWSGTIRGGAFLSTQA